MTTYGSQLGFVDYVGIIWRRRNAALLAAGLFACTTFVAFNFIPKRYTAQTVFERRADAVGTMTEKGTPAKFSTFKPTLVHDLTARSSVLAALTQLGYAKHPATGVAGQLTPDGSAELDRLAGAIAKDLRVTWIVQTNNLDQVNVSLSSTDIIFACSLTNRLVENYIADTRKKIIEQLSDSVVFLNERIAAAKAGAIEAREQRYNYLKGHPNMLPENPQFVDDQIAQLELRREQLRQDRKALDHKIAFLAGLKTGQDESNPDRVETAAQIHLLERQLCDLQNRLRMTDMHPRVLKLKRSIDQAKAKLKGMPTRTAVEGEGTSDKAAAIALDVDQLVAERKHIDILIARNEQLYAEYQTARANFLPVVQEYNRLTDLIAEADADVKMWRTNKAGVHMALEAEENGSRTHLQIVKAARPAYMPSWPKLWHVFILGIGGALAFGALLAVMMARMSCSFSSPAQAKEALGLPVVGTVGLILSPAAQRLQMIRRYVLIPAAACLLLLITIIAAAGVIVSANYPERYAQIIEYVSPATRSLWHDVQDILGLI